jgi:hypothetical protein
MSGTYDADSVNTMEPAVACFGVFGSDKSIEAEAPTLLHSLEDETEIHREFNTQLFVSLKDIEPSQDRALVIGRSASNELAIISNGQGKRISVPAIALESLYSQVLFRWPVIIFKTTRLTGWTSK